jgi:hypothetical protein
MRRQKLTGLIVVFTLLASGCGSGTVPETDPQPEPKKSPSLPEKLPGEVALAELLKKPREELAALGDEWLNRAQLHAQGQREGRVTFALLPELRLPLLVPVFREARYAPGAGVSLPPYAAGDRKDNALALHLVRYGDVEAASKFVDPKDRGLVARIEASRGERNYPLEWTRLVALLLHDAEWQLATGDPEGAAHLQGLHRQLRELLDAKAARSPLGAALLSRGRRALTLAASAWRQRGKEALANDATRALQEWGEVPHLEPAVAPGTEQAEVCRRLGCTGEGRVVRGVPALRALDLLDLPLPHEGAQAVLACFDLSARLNELLVLYRPGAAHVYPDPRHLVERLEDHGQVGEEVKIPTVRARRYRLDGQTCEVAVVPHGSVLGALARWGHLEPDLPPGSLARAFGSVNLDRSFEQNRLRLAPERGGAPVQTDREAALSQLVQPLQGARLVQAILERPDKYDVTSRLLLRFAGKGAAAPLHDVATGLWAAAGPARFTAGDDEHGGHCAFVWDDGQTRYTLRLGYANVEAIELDIEDARGGKDLARRAAAAQTFDREERKTRIDSGAPLTRLPRFLDYEGVQLGRTRTEVQQALPQGPQVITENLADGLNVILTGEAPRGVPYTPRQLFVRFNADGRAVELRTRYGEGKSSGGPWMETLLASLQKSCGAPSVSPGSWRAVWSDLPARKPDAVQSTWQDDLTQLSCERDAWGVELVLRDLGTQMEPAAPLPVLFYLPRGPAEIALGDSRADVQKRAGGKLETTRDGAVMVPPRSPVPYDAVLVWLEGDRVTRIVARPQRPGPVKARPSQLAQLLTEAWSHEVRAFGWPLRQDTGPEQALRGLGWHDDRTRVRMFWQDSPSGAPRLFTEWRELGKP